MQTRRIVEHQPRPTTKTENDQERTALRNKPKYKFQTDQRTTHYGQYEQNKRTTKQTTVQERSRDRHQNKSNKVK